MKKKLRLLAVLLTAAHNIHAATSWDWRAYLPSAESLQNFGMTCKRWVSENPGKTGAALVGLGGLGYLGYRYLGKDQSPATSTPARSSSQHIDVLADNLYSHARFAVDEVAINTTVQRLFERYHDFETNPASRARVLQIFEHALEEFNAALIARSNQGMRTSETDERIEQSLTNAIETVKNFDLATEIPEVRELIMAIRRQDVRAVEGTSKALFTFVHNRLKNQLGNQLLVSYIYTDPEWGPILNRIDREIDNINNAGNHERIKSIVTSAVINAR